MMPQGFFWELLKTKHNLKYRLGLTHQFNCEVCGAPIDEEPAEPPFSRMWDWRCEFCGWNLGGGHLPKVMKPQHMRVVAIRKAIWRLRCPL